jgi:purine-cytosine permease-like protein
MASRSSTPIIIALVVIVALAVVVHFFGPSIWHTLASLHGSGGSR